MAGIAIELGLLSGIFTCEEAARLLASFRARREAEKTTCPHCGSDETRRLSADEWECWNPDCRRT